MSNTECNRVKCVHNKMCNYLFELFNAQFTKVIDCNSYEEKRPQGEWIGGEIGHCSICGSEGCASDIWNGCNDGMYCPNCGAEMRGGRE